MTASTPILQAGHTYSLQEWFLLKCKKPWAPKTGSTTKGLDWKVLLIGPSTSAKAEAQTVPSQLSKASRLISLWAPREGNLFLCYAGLFYDRFCGDRMQTLAEKAAER